MDDNIKLNYSSSFSRRNTYVSNAADIISPAIKKQLKEYESDSEDAEQYSGQGSETSEDPEHLKSNAYSYVPNEYENHSFSDNEQENEEEESGESNEGVELRGDEDNQEDQEENTEEQAGLTGIPPLNLENLKDGYNSKTKFKDKSNSKTDSSYLNKVFSNLEKNLSDVRIEYQVSLSNSAIESSVRRKNCRLSHSNSILSSDGNNTNNNEDSNPQNTTNNNNKDNNKEHNSNIVRRGSKEFDLNKWFDELPEGLKNFVELESSRSQETQKPLDGSQQTQPSYNLRKVGSRNMYLQNITSPLKKQTQESTARTDEEEEEEGYIDILKKDYIEPIKEVFGEDLKNELKNDFSALKNELTDLYSKSPKIFQDLVSSTEALAKFKFKEDPKPSQKPEEFEEEMDKERRINLNLYYLESNRNNEYADSLPKEDKARDRYYQNSDSAQTERGTVLKPKKDGNKLIPRSDSCKVYNIFDKYECFDITDKPKLTHVSSFDISRNNQNLNLNVDPKMNEEDKDTEEDNEKKVIKSIGDYNIGFLSNLSRVNEKYQLLNDCQLHSNLIKPWFLNPLNEKIQSQAMCNQKLSESDRFNRNKQDKNYVINSKNNGEDIKYIINKENGNIRYLIDGGYNELPNKESKDKEQKRFTTLYQLESYYNNVDFDPSDSDRNKFYDPILHFKNYEDKKKKSINNTEWATFGRPLVKRIH